MTVKLLVDTTGAVTKVDLLTPPAPPFDEAVMTAARGFRFEPGSLRRQAGLGRDHVHA